MTYVDTWPQGQCTWRVAMYYMIPWSGNAMTWADGARSVGWTVGYTPHVGDIAVFQPGDNGALGDGHVAVVTAINGDGTYTQYEQNVTFGTAAPDYRTAMMGTGTQFITPPVSARTDQFDTLFNNSQGIPGGASSTLAVAQHPATTAGVSPLDIIGALPGPWNFFGVSNIFGPIAGNVLGQTITAVLGPVFTFLTKAGEVWFGVLAMALGVFVLVSHKDPVTVATSTVKTGAKYAAL